jgi:GDPmannose 4,6-dehydratase
MDAERDWGFAKDYVEAMWLMLQQDEPGDYVIGTGVSHSVSDVVDQAFACVGLDAADYVRQDPDLVRPADIDEVVANPDKAREVLGWQAATGFEELVSMMVEADLERLKATA